MFWTFLFKESACMHIFVYTDIRKYSYWCEIKNRQTEAAKQKMNCFVSVV